MKKKFLRGVAAFLAVMMMLPTAAFAEDPAAPADPADNTEISQLSDDNMDENAGDESGEEDSGNEEQEPAEPTGITIVATESKTLYNSGDSTTLQLEIAEDVDASAVEWKVYKGSDVVSVSKDGLVTAKSVGKATIRATYNTSTDVLHDDYDIVVVKRALTSIDVEENNYIERHYYTGESFDTKGITVTAYYSDDTSKELSPSEYTVTPSTMEEGVTQVEISYTYNGDTKKATVNVTVDDIAVESVKITTPTDGYEVDKNGKITKVVVDVKYNNGETETLTTSATSPNSKVTINGYTLGNAITKDTPITATVGDKTSDPVLVKVKASAALSGIAVTQTATAKTEYYIGEKFSYNGLSVTANYSDGSSKAITSTANLKYSPSSFTTTGSSIPVTITYTEGGVSKTATVYVKVSDKVDVTGFSTSSSYKSVLDEDAKVKLGDELDWEELFEYVYIKYTNSKNKTAYEKISDNDDLEDWLGDNAKLYVIVSGKTGNDEDVVEEDDIDDGEVTLKLYLEYAGKTYSSSSFDVEVSDVSCTVTVYRSSTSSTKIGDSKVFDDLKEALEYLEDKEDIIDDFGISSSYKNSFVVRIKLGEDQSLSSFEFAPDHEQDIIIDLNGCELRLKSEWIDYEDCEDITIVITNTNEDEYGTLTYNDLSTSLVVAEDSELEFTEGEIPMDSDAACMVTIYRSSSSSTVLGTKVYNTLKEALTALEEQEEVIEDYDISSSYEDTFVVKIKLGEDQNLSATTFTFTPDYDTTITIDCNGYTLRLRSEWIDYDDCEDLVVYVTNTNDDEDATMTYSDLSSSLTISEGDSLKFEEDEIPGIYDVTISSTTNGRITASKTTAAHGGTVTFTITPNSGYAISTVRVGTKSITTSTEGYTVNSNTGVGTYRMEDITADVTISATFKVSSTSSSSSSSSSSAADWTNPFTDVTKNAQYYDAVAFVCSEGLFNGMTATKFEPMTTMTRAMFVTVLGRLADIDVSKYSGTSFTDVSKTDQQISWATPYIEWAVQNGITQGTGNGKFSPNDPITHQQMYLFMYRYAMFVENITTPLTGVSLTSIRDAGEIADWAEEGVKFASKNGILITSGGKLTPADNALRCELAMLLEGFCTKVLGYND